jgi:hypothetical protein
MGHQIFHDSLIVNNCYMLPVCSECAEATESLSWDDARPDCKKLQ